MPLVRLPNRLPSSSVSLMLLTTGSAAPPCNNEALQAELDVNQQRVAQLERECTLLQQRFNEKTVALQQAENTCHDLKSRLHRQQRYTLQFKAALGKMSEYARQPQCRRNSSRWFAADPTGSCSSAGFNTQIPADSTLVCGGPGPPTRS
jgi:hypothetical protein